MSVLQMAILGVGGYLVLGILTATCQFWQIRRTRKIVNDFWYGGGSSKFRGTSGLLVGMGIQVMADHLKEWDEKPLRSKIWCFVQNALSWPLTWLFLLGSLFAKPS